MWPENSVLSSKPLPNWSGNGPQPGLTSTRTAWEHGGLAGKHVGCARDQPPILELIPSGLPARAATRTVRLQALKPCPSLQASTSDRNCCHESLLCTAIGVPGRPLKGRTSQTLQQLLHLIVPNSLLALD